jgi:polyphosphate kinase 2 (PPK2 family)
MLDRLDMNKRLDVADYVRQLVENQLKLRALAYQLYLQKRNLIIVFEGWDAAGKGTTINKISQRLDPRGFKLYAIQAPRTYEQHMPWLWRFWLKVPNYGEMAIFDRSWYGRVMVERVEKLTPQPEWMAAYKDIVDFERTLADDGYILIKFFLHISKKEQRRRFKKVEKDPLESWHVQPEDWEHHRKYGKYLVAIEEMLERTETEWGPWTIVEATDRRHEQVKVIETIISRLEEALKKKGIPLPLGPEEEPPAKPVEEAKKVEQAKPEAVVVEPPKKRSHHKAKPVTPIEVAQPPSELPKSPVATWENEGGAPVEGSIPSNSGVGDGQSAAGKTKPDRTSQGEG